MASNAPTNLNEPYGENSENAGNISSETPETQSAHAHTVRFSSKLQEIEPSHGLDAVDPIAPGDSKPGESLGPEAQERIRNLSISLQKSNIQHRRLEQFSFEPVSLPASRVGIMTLSPDTSMIAC
jgi:hypothetical protein